MNDEKVATESARVTLRRRPSRAFTITVFTVFIAAGGYIAYQRVGTHANVEELEFTTNLAGGFLALGMTDEQPGVLVLSALDRAKVDLATYMMANPITGRATTLEIECGDDSWSCRLRRPRIITIGADGKVSAERLDWSLADFKAARKAVDCEDAALHDPNVRCGMPFADLFDHFRSLPAEKQPPLLRTFLQPPRISRKLYVTATTTTNPTEEIPAQKHDP